MKSYVGEGNNQRETCPNATLSPQIPHVLVWNLTRTFEIRGWKISNLATVRPLTNVMSELNIPVKEEEEEEEKEEEK